MTPRSQRLPPICSGWKGDELPPLAMPDNPQDAAALSIDAAGWLAGARQIASPNHDSRPAGTAPSLIVIHAISLPPDQFGGSAIVDFFTNRLDVSAHPYYASIGELRVSAHFLLDRAGAITQFVSCLNRAWHAGASSWRGRSRCNDFSLGIELEGCDSLPFTAAQYHALRRLIAALQARYPITDIAGHSDIAPGRKTDPGPHFDWSRLQDD